ncbi:hypothetical protein HY993_02005 [Candidatus Micrarchaeota archaeon]|nr:hypothetical protein [Candidatus Micrarchaeota archaeon]
MSIDTQVYDALYRNIRTQYASRWALYPNMGNMVELKNNAEKHSNWFAELYTPVLTHMLIDHRLTPNRKRNLEQCLEKLFNKNKTVLEVGCRQGDFLRFVSQYGARVIGNTDKPILHTALEFGPDTLFIEGNAETALRKLGGENPHIIVSVNLFDENRWKLGQNKIKPQELLNRIIAAGSNKTRYYIHPATDSTSALEESNLQTHDAIDGISVNQLRENKNSRTYAFRKKIIRRK